MKRISLVVLAVCLWSVPTQAQVLNSGTLSSLNDVLCATTGSSVALNFQITGTYSGTITFQGAANQQNTLASIEVSNTSSGTAATTTTSTGIFATTNTGYLRVCAAMTSYASGVARVSITQGFGAGGPGGGGGASGDVNLTEVGGAAVALGQTTMSASIPVVLSSNQSAITALVGGGLAANGQAAATDRLAVLPAIAETGALPTLTDGRNAALYVNTNGALFVAPSSGSFATDAVFGTTTYTEASSTGPLVGAVRTDTPAALANTTNEVAPLSSSSLGGLYIAHVNDPCGRLVQSTFVVDIVTATTTEIANASASNKLYVCSVNLVAGGAQNVAIVEDDSDTCASPTAGMNGGVTAGEGWNFAANGGIALPNTGFSHMETSVVNRYVCIITSAGVQLSGTVKYVLAP